MLNRILITLARSAEFPLGSKQCGYEFFAPLDQSGHLDLEAWKRLREKCSVRHFWIDEDDKFGLLIHRSGGSDGARWCIDYGSGSDDNDTGFRLDKHVFRVGEYVSIRDADGEQHTYVVASTIPIHHI